MLDWFIDPVGVVFIASRGHVTETMWHCPGVHQGAVVIALWGRYGILIYLYADSLKEACDVMSLHLVFLRSLWYVHAYLSSKIASCNSDLIAWCPLSVDRYSTLSMWGVNLYVTLKQVSMVIEPCSISKMKMNMFYDNLKVLMHLTQFPQTQMLLAVSLLIVNLLM